MKPNNFIFIILVLLMFIPVVNADLGTYKQNECVLIKTLLNTSTINISTINYPNSTTVLSNIEMVKVGQTFTYNFCNTTVLGTYIYDFLDAEGNPYVNSFTITKTGNIITIADSILYICIFLLLLSFFLLCIYKLFMQTEVSLFLIFLALSYFLLISVIFMAGKLINNFMPTLPVIGEFMDLFLLCLIIGLFPLVLFMIFYPLYLKVKNQESEDMMAMGYSAEESRKFRKR
jgi:hypothetical protein